MMRGAAFSRRGLLGGALALGLAGRAGAAADPLGAIAARIGGRLGVSAFDTGTGRRLWIDPQGRYPLLSTVKLPLAAAILARVDRGELALDRAVRVSQADIIAHSPVVERRVAAGTMRLDELCEAALVASDNAAANLLLPQVGGPRGLTRFLRESGDRTTRSDRDEPTLNDFRRDDPRDTTTPAAMTALMATLLTGRTLSEPMRARLVGWMAASTTGTRRLRAGLPPDWAAGDKTGTGARGLVNDIAIATPPGRKPVLVAAFVDSPDTPVADAEAAIADIGRLVGQLFA